MICRGSWRWAGLGAGVPGRGDFGCMSRRPALDWALRGGLLLGFGAVLPALGVIRGQELRELRRMVRGAIRRVAGA